MILAEARFFVGKVCSILWQDRDGSERETVSRIHDATYVPLYGGYVITDSEDIRLDRIHRVFLVGELVEAVAGTGVQAVDRMAA